MLRYFGTTYSSKNENIHYKKDGTPDMRFKTSKNLHTTKKESENKSVKLKKKSDDNGEPHFKKDGTPDMRFTSSKRAAVQSRNVKPPSYYSNLITRKDGNLDMRYKINQEYAQLPKDSNGDIIENSPEAISFRKEHSLNLAPKTDFDFDFGLDDYEPVIYTGPVFAIQRVFQTATHTGKKYLGKLTLYHATSREAAENIMREGSFMPGKSGMFGAAMYFADKVKSALHKAAKLSTNGQNAIIVAIVDMGKALVVEGPNTTLNLSQVNHFGCNSVLGRKCSNSEWEYVVYEPSRVKPIQMNLL